MIIKNQPYSDLIGLPRETERSHRLLPVSLITPRRLEFSSRRLHLLSRYPFQFSSSSSTHTHTPISSKLPSIPQNFDDQREEFVLLGHPMKLKRSRGSSTSSPTPCKRLGIETNRAAVKAWGKQPLSEADPEIHDFMEKEKQRQFRGIELIAS